MSRILTIAALLACCLLVTVAGCNKLNINIPGSVTGQLLNAGGQPQGYTSVKLCDVASGNEVQVQTSEDSGNFFFEKVPPGEYIIKVGNVGGSEMPCDSTPFKLGPGKTLSLTITITGTGAEEKAGGEG
jgi:hypothetical protein